MKKREFKTTASQRTILVITASVFLFHVCSAILCKRHYYADGAYALVNLVNQQNELLPLSYDANTLRMGAEFINQLLVILCLKFGIRSIGFLSIVFGISLFFNSVVGMTLCWRKCRYLENGRNLILFPFAAYAFFCLPADIFSLNPAFTAFWIDMVLFFYIISENKKTIDKLILGVLLILAATSYETYLAIGPLLLLISLMEIKNQKQNPVKRKELIIISIGIVSGVIVNILYKATHHPPTEGSFFTGFLSFLNNSKNILTSNLLISLVGLFLVVLGISKLLDKRWIWLSMAALGIIYIMVVRYYYHFYSPVSEYTCRILIAVGMAGGILLAYAYYRLYDTVIVKNICITNWWRAAIIVFVLQCVWQYGNTYEWNQYLTRFSETVRTNEGIIEDPHKENPFSWGWTQPSLSLLESEANRINCLVAPNAYQISVNNGVVYIPFLYINNDVFDMSTIIAYENNKFSAADCQNVSLSCDPQRDFTRENGNMELSVEIYNNGEKTLENKNLFASYHIYFNDERVVWDGPRVEIDQNIAPGESYSINVPIDDDFLSHFLLQEGNYSFVLDLVREHEYWFHDSGMQKTEITLYYRPAVIELK